MKQKSHIYINAWLLTLIYLIGSLPTALFHQHELEDYSKKHFNFYTETAHHQHNGDFCSHESQYEANDEHCTFCDNHVNAPHLGLHSESNFYLNFHFSHHRAITHRSASFNFTLIDNRGPPSIL